MKVRQDSHSKVFFVDPTQLLEAVFSPQRGTGNRGCGGEDK